MDTNLRPRTHGQAAVEFAIGVFLLSFLIAFLVSFAPVFIGGLDQQSAARLDAGLAAVSSEPGSGGMTVSDGGVDRILSFADVREGGGLDAARKPLSLCPGFSSKEFDVLGEFMGAGFSNGAFTLKEEAYMPASGVPR